MQARANTAAPSALANFLKWCARLIKLNLIAWFAMNFTIGGDAPSGKVVQGHYFVSSHDQLTEVSRTVFEFSLWHTYITWLTFGSMWLIALGHKWRKDRKTLRQQDS